MQDNLFGLTKTGRVYSTLALGNTPISTLISASVILQRRFVVAVQNGENLRLVPQFKFALECTFTMRNLCSLDHDARVFLLSGKNKFGELAATFEERVPSPVQFSKPSTSPSAAVTETALVSFDADEEWADTPDPETMEVPAFLPPVITLTENSWVIGWLTSLLKANDISRLRNKLKPESQDQFVVGLKKRIAQYHKAVATFTKMQSMPQLETRVEDPVKDESIAKRIEEGEVSEGDFVSQDAIEAQRAAIDKAIASLQAHLDSYSAAIASIPLSDLPTRLVDICSATIHRHTAKPADYSVLGRTPDLFLSNVQAALNTAAQVVIDRVSVE